MFHECVHVLFLSVGCPRKDTGESLAPLGCHCVCHPDQGARPFLPPVRARACVMNAGRASFDDVGRFEWGKILEPEACGFGFAVAELPGLNDLVRFAPACGHDANGILDCDLFNGRIGERHKEIDSRLLLCLFPLEPSRATDTEVRAGREGNHQVPAEAQQMCHILLKVVLSAALAGQQVT
jgi:hypothetical protein